MNENRAMTTPTTVKEMTLRGIVLGALLTVIFTAANVYLGLKVGLTFATSIPAAVISMALLRLFKTGTIQENNIVQTIASAAGIATLGLFGHDKVYQFAGDALTVDDCRRSTSHEYRKYANRNRSACNGLVMEPKLATSPAD